MNNQRPVWLDTVCVCGWVGEGRFLVQTFLHCGAAVSHPTSLTLPDSQYLHSTNIPACGRGARRNACMCVWMVTVPTIWQITPVLFTSCLDHIGQACVEIEVVETKGISEQLVCAGVHELERERDRKWVRGRAGSWYVYSHVSCPLERNAHVRNISKHTHKHTARSHHPTKDKKPTARCHCVL